MRIIAIYLVRWSSFLLKINRKRLYRLKTVAALGGWARSTKKSRWEHDCYFFAWKSFKRNMLIPGTRYRFLLFMLHLKCNKKQHNQFLISVRIRGAGLRYTIHALRHVLSLLADDVFSTRFRGKFSYFVALFEHRISTNGTPPTPAASIWG